MVALSAGLGIGIAAAGAALGQGRVGAAALEGIARQPEMAGKIQTNMIIALALIESLAIYALLISMVLLFFVGLPKADDVMKLLQASGGHG